MASHGWLHSNGSKNTSIFVATVLLIRDEVVILQVSNRAKILGRKIARLMLEHQSGLMDLTPTLGAGSGRYRQGRASNLAPIRRFAPG